MFRWVTVVLEMVFVLLTALFIEPPSIPFPLFGDRVGSPMQVDSKLSISEPLRALVLTQRSDGGLELLGGLN